MYKDKKLYNNRKHQNDKHVVRVNFDYTDSLVDGGLPNNVFVVKIYDRSDSLS